MWKEVGWSGIEIFRWESRRLQAFLSGAFHLLLETGGRVICPGERREGGWIRPGGAAESQGRGLGLRRK